MSPVFRVSRVSSRGPRVGRLLGIAAALAVFAAALIPGLALAHEVREVAGYQVVIGFIDEPVFVGQKSGLELFVTRDDQPVAGLEQTLQAEVIKDDQRRELPLSPRFGEEGAYQSYFFPTVAGPYTFHVFGSIEGNEIDESFTSSPDGFSEVEEVSAGQFPLVLPGTAEVAQDARNGAAAASQVPLAIGLGVAGLVAGLIALGVALASRRRA
jgi:hypothetical protein